ncbi:MAG: Ig-like domain-containing protein [Archangiaceae bacterium]|nr:Ig-like domain-containing protein [Archangiaceae bacterium]
MRRLSLGLLVLAAAACDKIDYIELEPSEVVLKQPNNEAWLVAHGKSRQGRPGLRVVVGWSSADPSIATVDNTGKVKPVKSGHTEIVAKYKDVEARVPVDVLYVEKVAVEPTELKLVQDGESVELHAKAFDYRGKELKDRTPTFNGSDAKVISVAQNAVFGMGAGNATVTVQIDGIKTTVPVTVEKAKAAKK